jgi:2,3-dihydroxybiphenyl 1,2-dioxygenase
MTAGLALGYLVFDVRRPNRWQTFCRDMLGLPGPVANADGSTGWRIDDRVQRLIVRPGKADDLAALGLACDDDAGLDALTARLAAAGLAVEAGDAATLASRRVARLRRVLDPMGNPVELHTGLAPSDAPFVSGEMPGGFHTGDHGLGHAVLVAHDLAAMERFYVGLLGFGVTERLETAVGPITVRGTFLHCNRRHHSLALFDLPLRQRLHHFMLQANDFADVGRAFERARRLKVPLSLGLGQHPAPDATFSFYGATPSGFDFEIGAGSRAIEPVDWETMRTDVASSWGHKPQLRLQLKMAKELAIRSLGGHKRSATPIS